MRHIKRGGIYLRSLGPRSLWPESPDNTSYSKRRGGRWNGPGEFGVLYLSRDADVAFANGLEIVKRIIAPAASLDDLNDPESFFEVQEFMVEESRFVDAVTPKGRAELGLPEHARKGENYHATRAIGKRAYARDEHGIAAESAAYRDGEELAVFDSHVRDIAKMRGARQTFAQWRVRRHNSPRSDVE